MEIKSYRKPQTIIAALIPLVTGFVVISPEILKLVNTYADPFTAQIISLIVLFVGAIVGQNQVNKRVEIAETKAVHEAGLVCDTPTFETDVAQ